MWLVRWLLLGLVLATATGAVCEEPRTGPRPLRQDETRTLPTTADRAAVTGPPIRMADATARLGRESSADFVGFLGGAGEWILVLRKPLIGPDERGEPEFLLWNPETDERQRGAPFRIYPRLEEDYREAIGGFDGEWLLVAFTPRDEGPPGELVIFNVKTGEQRSIATFEPDALNRQWRPATDGGLSLIDGKVLIAETVRRGSSDERDQIRVYTIDQKRWETLVDFASPPGDTRGVWKAMLGGDWIAWQQLGSNNRYDTIVVLDWMAGRRVRFDPQVEFEITLLALSADGRYMIWAGRAPATPTGPNSFQQERARLFVTDLQTMESIHVGQGNTPPDILPKTTNARFASMAAGPLSLDHTIWGIAYDMRAAEVRPIVGEPFRGSEAVTVLGDWLVVGERGETQPGDRHPADVETLYFFKLPR